MAEMSVCVQLGTVVWVWVLVFLLCGAGECGRNVLLIIGNTSYLLETIINKSLMSVNDMFIIRF